MLMHARTRACTGTHTLSHTHTHTSSQVCTHTKRVFCPSAGCAPRKWQTVRASPWAAASIKDTLDADAYYNAKRCLAEHLPR
eukprot:UN2974